MLIAIAVSCWNKIFLLAKINGLYNLNVIVGQFDIFTYKSLKWIPGIVRIRKIWKSLLVIIYRLSVNNPASWLSRINVRFI